MQNFETDDGIPLTRLGQTIKGFTLLCNRPICIKVVVDDTRRYLMTSNPQYTPGLIDIYRGENSSNLKQYAFQVSKMNIWFIVFAWVIPAVLSERTFRINNQCNQKLWFGIQGQPLIYSGGFDVEAHATKDIRVPDGWVRECVSSFD